MLLTNLALFTAIGLAVVASGAYIVHRVRAVGRDARRREQRRAAELLAQVAGGAVRTTTPYPGAPAAQPPETTDRLDAALSSFFTAAPAAPSAPVGRHATPRSQGSQVTEPELVTCARDLAARLRLTADRIDEVAAGSTATAQETSEVIVSLATEATSPAALRPVIMAAHGSSTGPA